MDIFCEICQTAQKYHHLNSLFNMKMKHDHLFIWVKYKQKYTHIQFGIYMLIKGTKYIQSISKEMQFPSLATDKSTFLTQTNNAATYVIFTDISVNEGAKHD